MTPRQVTATPAKANKKPQETRNKGGRPKGSLNKVTQSVKAALEEAFDGLGGVPALERWAHKEPAAFYSLWGRLIPKNIEVGTANGPIIVTFRHEGK